MNGIEKQKQSDTLILTMNREPVNAMNLPFLVELERLLLDASEDSSVRSVVLDAKGKCFSAGIDKKAIIECNVEELEETIRVLNHVSELLYFMEKPTIACVNGATIGAGMIFFLACDARLASPISTFSLPEVQFGLPFPTVTMEIVKEELPRDLIRKMVLQAQKITVDEALHFGILDKKIEASLLSEQAMQLAQRLSNFPIYAMTKRNLQSKIKKKIKEMNTESGSLFSEE